MSFAFYLKIKIQNSFRIKIAAICYFSVLLVFYFYFCKVDAGFTFVAGVVADVESIVVPQKAGITRIAAAGEFCQFGHSAAFDVNVCQGGMGAALVHSSCGKPVSARDFYEIGAAETIEIRAEVFELPLLIIRSAYTQQGSAWICTATVSAYDGITSPIIIKTQCHFIRVTLLEKLWYMGLEVNPFGTYKQIEISCRSFTGGIGDTISFTFIPGDAPEPSSGLHNNLRLGPFVAIV